MDPDQTPPPYEPPEGATTGRWNILSGAERSRARGSSSVPIWYRVLEKFGLPTLIVLLLLFGGYRLFGKALEIWERTQEHIVLALDKLTEKIVDLDHSVRDRHQ